MGSYVAGDGPPVVLLHGWPQTSSAWRQVAPALVAAGYTVVAPDLPGVGSSGELASGYGKDDQATALRQVLYHLGLDGPVRLVGHDIGGMIAFSWARQFPDEVARLALVDLAIPGLGLEQAMDVARGGRWHFGFFMAEAVPEFLIDGHEEQFFAHWFATLAASQRAFPPDVIAETTAAYRGSDALRRGFGHYRTLLTDGQANADWLTSGGQLPMPVAAIGGEHAVGDRLAQAVHRAAPHVEAVVVAGAGHFVAEEQPQTFLAHLIPFLR
ncbi:hypothetical protein VV01_21430 [Luteipulveratus halotolerans]|uniref:AB hydrolase-1 domain-containing protein n=1 Tax=Luteipulveratus halotolerans TaxID=1631356 RepID=A0A0L6CE58_9MICO|nr:hypothetical protein VV01_21430 [Luteipulveratus halotolerans]